MKDLLRDYDPNVRPVFDPKEAVKVTLDLLLMRIVNLVIFILFSISKLYIPQTKAFLQFKENIVKC